MTIQELLKLPASPKMQSGGTADRNQSLLQKTMRPLDTQPAQQLSPMMPNLAPGIDAGRLAPMKQQTISPQGPKGLGLASGIAGSVGGVADMAGDLVESLGKKGPINTWGFEAPNAKKTVAVDTLKTAGKWASMGASIGSAVPGLGTVIGAGIGLIGGAIAGLFKGKKKAREEKKEYKDNTQMAYESYNQKAAAQQYAALAKCGAKLSVMNKVKSSKRDKISWNGRKFKMKAGGKLDKLGAVNVIPSGTLHKENNNLGQKDKGIPIIDGAGKKVFEVEREELILRLKATKTAEDYVQKYKKSHNDRHLVDLGKFLSEEIMTNTHDFSGKYGLEVEP